MLVGCAGLSLNAVLGVVPRLECSEVVGSDDLYLDSVSLVVQANDLQAFKAHLLGCFFVRVGEHTLGACIMTGRIPQMTWD
jgi:hypothetical protein